MTQRWLGLSDAAALLHETVASLERKILQRQMPARQTASGWQVCVDQAGERPDSGFMAAVSQMTREDTKPATETGALNLMTSGGHLRGTSGETAAPPADSNAVGNDADSGRAAPVVRSETPLKPPPPPSMADIPRPWLGLVAVFLLLLLGWLWLTIRPSSVAGRDRTPDDALALNNKARDEQGVPDWIIEYDEPVSAAPPLTQAQTSGAANVAADEVPDMSASEPPSARVTAAPLPVFSSPVVPSKPTRPIEPQREAPPQFGQWRSDDLTLGSAAAIGPMSANETLTASAPVIPTGPAESAAAAIEPVADLEADLEADLDIVEPRPVEPLEVASRDDRQEDRKPDRVESAAVPAPEPIAARWSRAERARPTVNETWADQLGGPAQFVLLMSPMETDPPPSRTPAAPEADVTPAPAPEPKPKPSPKPARPDNAPEARTAEPARPLTADDVSRAPASAQIRPTEVMPAVNAPTTTKPAHHQPAKHAFYCPDCFN